MDKNREERLLTERGLHDVPQSKQSKAAIPKILNSAYWMPSNSTSKTSVLLGGIAGLGLFSP